MRNSYRDRLKLPDWAMKQQLFRWIFEGRCPACGDATLPHELHHNSDEAYKVMPFERPEHLISFCPVCHAVFEWVKLHWHEILAVATRHRERVERVRISLVDVGEVFRGLEREASQLLDEAEARMKLSHGMADAWSEHQQRTGRRVA